MPVSGKDIQSGIHITIMRCATATATPMPYSKVCDTSRPRIRLVAATRADLGAKRFAHFLKPRAMPNGLVREHASEGRPATVQYRLGHAGFCQSSRIDIANGNVVKAPNDLQGLFMQKVPSGVGDFRVNGVDKTTLAGALCASQGFFQVPVVFRILDLLPVGQGCKILQAQVDANSVVQCLGSDVWHLDADIQKPVTTGVSREIRAVFDGGANGQASAFEYLELASVEVKATRGFFQLPPLQWHPTQMLFAAVAKIGALLLASGLGVLLAHRVNRARVNTKLFAAASSELVQVKPREPFAAKAYRVFLAIVAIVPDKVHRTGLLVEQAI